MSAMRPALLAESMLALRTLRARLAWREQHARNLFSFFVCRGIAILSFAASVPYFVRTRGNTEYGVIALLFSVFSYISILDMGIGYAVNLRYTRALARGRGRASRVVAAAIPVFFGIGMAVSLLLFALAGVSSELLFGTSRFAGAVRVLSATSLFVFLSAVLTSVLQSYNRVDLVNYSRLTLDIAKACGLAVAAFSRSAVTAAMWAIFCGVVLRVAVDIAFAKRTLGKISVLKPVFSADEMRINLRFGLPMAVSSLASILLVSIDRIYVSRVLGHEALTSYSIAADVCSKAFFLVWAVTGSVYTLLIRRRAARLDSTLLQQVSLGSVALVAAFFYLPLLVFAPQLLSWWLGPALPQDVVPTLRVWAIAAIAYLTFTVYYNYLQAAGRPRVLLGVNAAAAGAMILALRTMPTSLGPGGVGAIVCAVFTAEALALWVVSRMRFGASVT